MDFCSHNPTVIRYLKSCLIMGEKEKAMPKTLPQPQKTCVFTGTVTKETVVKPSRDPG